MMKPDAVIDVRFLTLDEGGRKDGIQGESYGCPLIIGDHGFDCRFVLDKEMYFELGEAYQIPIKFLNTEGALAHLQENETITLWEGKTIATGEVVKLFI